MLLLCSCIFVEKEKPIEYDAKDVRVILPQEGVDNIIPPQISPQIGEKKPEEPLQTPIEKYPSQAGFPPILQEEGSFAAADNIAKKIEIGLLLPMSGKNKELGMSLLNAATVSLFENDREKKIKLVIFDSNDDAKSTESAFRKIIDRKIKYVIGPVFSNSLLAIEKLARDNSIVVISLSNNSDMLGKISNNGGIFIGGIYPQSQIDKITNYAIDRGKMNFAIIAPNSQYGQTITQYLKASVRSRNANFITSEFYDSSGRDIDRVVERAINSFMIPESIKNNKSERAINEYDRTYPEVILIPESGKILSKIVASIKKQNVKEREIQLIGTSQWDEISTLNDSNLTGAWFPAPESREFYNFEKRYYNIFKKIPPRISSISYDAVNAIIAVLRKNHLNSENMATIKHFIDYSENGKSGFAGIDGSFRFLPNGAIQRNLSVLRVGNGDVNVLEKPAETFSRY